MRSEAGFDERPGGNARKHLIGALHRFEQERLRRRGRGTDVPQGKYDGVRILFSFLLQCGAQGGDGCFRTGTDFSRAMIASVATWRFSLSTSLANASVAAAAFGPIWPKV